MDGARSGSKDQVRAFWEAEACGERYGPEQDQIRYRLEPEILGFAEFDSASGRRVLEIGVGMGSDFLRWVRAGADATGVDLTERAVAITGKRLEENGLAASVQVADAESLPFEDAQFDIVYSWGVLHHTPNPRRALQEAQRVLAPNGQLKVMLYHRRSWVGVAAWARFCLLRGRVRTGLGDGIAHMESPGTQAFTASEVRSMLPQLTNLSITPKLTSWDRRCAPLVSELLGDRLGWFLLIEGTRS